MIKRKLYKFLTVHTSAYMIVLVTKAVVMKKNQCRCCCSCKHLGSGTAVPRISLSSTLGTTQTTCNDLTSHVHAAAVAIILEFAVLFPGSAYIHFEHYPNHLLWLDMHVHASAVASTLGVALLYPGSAYVDFGHYSNHPPFLSGLGPIFLTWLIAPILSITLVTAAFIFTRNSVLRGEDPFHKTLWVRLPHQESISHHNMCWHA